MGDPPSKNRRICGRDEVIFRESEVGDEMFVGDPGKPWGPPGTWDQWRVPVILFLGSGAEDNADFLMISDIFSYGPMVCLCAVSPVPRGAGLGQMQGLAEPHGRAIGKAWQCCTQKRKKCIRIQRSRKGLFFFCFFRMIYLSGVFFAF